MHKWILFVLLAGICVLPAAAQQGGKNPLGSKIYAALQRAVAKQNPTRHCLWCGRAETQANAYTPCPADPDVMCVFVDNEKAAASTQAAPAPKKVTQETPVDNTPISDKHCLWCGRAETQANAHAPCPADPDVSCFFVAEEQTPQTSSQNAPSTR